MTLPNQPLVYLVWNPQGQNPTMMHRTATDAIIESERLARLHRGQKFYVMQAVGVSFKPDEEQVYTALLEIANR